MPFRLPSGFRSVPLTAALGLVLALTACSKSESPSSPTPPQTTPANVAGSWSGTASDSSGPGSMTWVLTQSGASFSGTLTMTDTQTNLTGRGTVSGSANGTSLTFSVTVPAGGFDAPYNTCSATVSGSATASASAITGSYSGSGCNGTISSGQLTLNKQ